MQKNYLQLSLKQKAKFILFLLKQDYPIIRTPLIHKNVFELLISAMLSPQTTDEVVNSVTPILFTKYPTPFLLGNAKNEDILKIIYKVNFNKTKSKRIITASQIIANQYNKKVPYQLSLLTKIPGVGRKIANVVINDWYCVTEKENQPYNANQSVNNYNSINRGTVFPEGIVVDTHVARVANTLLLTKSKDPLKIELDLMHIFPKSEWWGISLRMIFHGREVLPAKKPRYLEFANWREIYTQIYNSKQNEK